jgi:ABC-type transport system substrate-binding protein
MNARDGPQHRAPAGLLRRQPVQRRLRQHRLADLAPSPAPQEFARVGAPSLRGAGGQPEPGYVEGQPQPGIDPKLNDMAAKLRRELDPKKQVELVQDYQKYLADKMYDIPMPGYSYSYGLTWPFVMNLGVYRSWVATASPPQEGQLYLWLDRKHPKFKQL